MKVNRENDSCSRRVLDHAEKRPGEVVSVSLEARFVSVLLGVILPCFLRPALVPAGGSHDRNLISPHLAPGSIAGGSFWSLLGGTEHGTSAAGLFHPYDSRFPASGGSFYSLARAAESDLVR